MIFLVIEKILRRSWVWRSI